MITSALLLAIGFKCLMVEDISGRKNNKGVRYFGHFRP